MFGGLIVRFEQNLERWIRQMHLDRVSWLIMPNSLLYKHAQRDTEP